MTEPSRQSQLAGSAHTIGSASETLDERAVASFVGRSLAGADLDGRSVCVIVPDGTRSCPLPLLMRAVHSALAGRVSRLTALVALGTHAAMSENELARHFGYPPGGAQTVYPGMRIVNHEWWRPEALTSLGTIDGATVATLSEGRMREPVAVVLNRAVVEHDVALVVGPVFPHEVVGFSGGNKYFFPGVAGQEVIDFSHWLGALITSAEIIGTRGITPVRALINTAAELIPAQRLALCMVAQSGSSTLHALSFGSPEAAWAACADISAETHIRYLDAPVRRVVSVMPAKYQDMWTAAKGFYKVEPVVADGGQVIIYAPHITQLAATHPAIEKIGYHCKEYFLKRWDEFSGYHWGELAHSTHLRGAGTYDDIAGEASRVTVTLATGINEHTVRAANLDYLDPMAVDIAALEADPGTLVVQQAGEILYRLR